MRLLGEGGIRPLDEGRCARWEVWQFVDDGGERRQRARRVKGGKRDAQRALEAFRDELAGLVPNSESFASYAARWALMRRNSGEYGVGTLENDKRHIAALCRVIGAERMDALTPELCREALSVVKHDFNASGRTLSNTYMNGVQVTFSAVMHQAASDGLVASNPLQGLKLPRMDTAEKKAMDEAQLAAMLDALDAMPLDGRVVAVYLMAEMGLRRGEACAVMAEDVHDGLVEVRHAVKERTGEIGRPKSASGVRTLPMTARLADAVGRWIELRAEEGLADAPTLCCARDGQVLWPQNLERWWNANRDALGAGGYTMHELRHTNLTIMARVLGSPFDLKDWAGWSTLAPASIYVHRSLDALKDAVSRVDSSR